MNLREAMEDIEVYQKANIPTFLWGPSGIGKSDGIRQIAAKHKWPVIDFRALLRDPVDLRGLPTVDLEKRKAVWLSPDDLPNEQRDGKHGIFFADELNTAPPSVMNACLGLFLDGKLGEYTFPQHWWKVAAGNRQSDRASVNKMPLPLSWRFAHIDVEPDLETFVDYCIDKDLDVMVPAFLRFRPNLLHSMEGTDLRACPNPRNWERVSRCLDAPDKQRLRLIGGIIGAGPSGEFEAFVRTFKDLPNFDDILADPKGTLVPSDPSGKYAVSGMLSRRVKRQNFTSALIYAKRLGREFEIVTVLDATKRDSSLCDTSAFRDFALRNKDVTLPVRT